MDGILNMKRLLLYFALALFIIAPFAMADTAGVDLNISLNTTSPAVSSASIASLTDNSATITWLTDIPADGMVEYGEIDVYDFATPLDTAMTLTHSATITDLQPGTIYHFTILSADSSGVFEPFPDNTFTTLPAAQPPPPSVGGGGGSGGGGGMSVKPKANNSLPLDSIKITVVTQPSVLVKVDVPKNFPIVSFTVRSPRAANTSITLTNLGSANVPIPSQYVYDYMRLDGNTTNLEYISLQFQVNMSWLNLNGFDTGDVKMVRYFNGAWQRLDTYYIDSNGTVDNFQSLTPGFSVFAIIAEKVAPPEVPHEVLSTNNQSNSTPVTISNIPPIVSLDSKYPVNVQYFILALVMIVIAIMLFLYDKHRRRGKSYKRM